jgi:poly-gamma-glutamate capsule biosynthesis protein CapA/YwtB (metallophosphatase superfamily)
VWQRQQSAYASMGDFDFGRDAEALWGIPANNVFIVKVNYWLGL